MIGFFLDHVSQVILLLVTMLTGIMVFVKIEHIFVKLILISSLAFLYFLFGIFHHLLEKNLNLWLVLEYLLISILLLWSMLALSYI